MYFTIETLSASPSDADLADLTAIVCDMVAGGASVGFMPPIDAARYAAFWREVVADIAAGRRVVLVARAGSRIVGTAQLALATRENSLHRAEVQKVLVLRTHRRKGVGTALMLALDEVALTLGRTCLVLDTGAGGNAQGVYLHCGYTRVGVIPRFALNTDGTYCDTIYYYKLLEPAAKPGEP